MSVTLSGLPETAAGVPGGRAAAGDERPLVHAARRGDRAAFAALHDRYAALVHGILLARVPVHEADDLVQEVFLKALRKLRGLRDPDAVGPWLASIARRAAARHHRRRRRLQALPEEIPAEPPSADPAVAAEARRALAAVRSLPEAYRETLVLRLVEGLTGPQIAACTGMTAGSVRVNLHRGMRLLRQRLEEQAVEGLP